MSTQGAGHRIGMIFRHCQRDSRVYDKRVDQEYTWSGSRGGDSYRLPGPEHLGRWAAVAMLLSILLHIMVFFALDHVKFALGIQAPEELKTAPVNIRRMEVKPYEEPREAVDETLVQPPSETAALLEEIDLLDMLPPDAEIDILTEAADPSYALKLSQPLAEGELDAPDTEFSSNFDLDDDLPDYGRMDTDLAPAAVGQITVDPGAVSVDDGEMASFTDDLMKRGNEGMVAEGKLDGMESLDSLLDLPSNVLLSKKTLLPSDLIFEFNRAELKDGAKIGLMKLGLLMDKNPSLYCWIEGHTDLIGGDETNLMLSQRRAEAVKEYLVESMRMEPQRIFARGFGKSMPLVKEGDMDVQSPNRRVEIRMRRTPPPEEPVKIMPKVTPEIAPPKAAKVEELPKAKPVPVVPDIVMPEVLEEPPPPKAVLVKPNIIPEIIPEEEPAAPRALIVPERELAPLRAEPVEPEPRVRKALPVEP